MKAFLNASRAEIITLGGSEQLGGDLKQEATFVQTLIVFRCLIPIQLVLSLSIENLECGNLGTHLCVRVAHKSKLPHTHELWSLMVIQALALRLRPNKI